MTTKNGQFWLLNFWLLCANVWVTQGFDCPPPASIIPCTCAVPTRALLCSGPNVTQDSLTVLFQAVRTANELEEGQYLDIIGLTIERTDLEILNLEPISYSKIDEILIRNNPALEIFSATSNPGSIGALSLSLSENNLTDSGLSKSLQSFSSRLQTFRLTRNRIEGGQYPLDDGSGDIEFLPGFSSFSKLETLVLSNNQISVVGGGQFKRNGMLTTLDLSSNQISLIQSDAFLVNFDDPDGSEVRRKIDLSFNELTDQGIDPKHALYGWPNQTFVELRFNKFEDLSLVNWEPFLLAQNYSDVLNFEFNSFYCDIKMKWLHENKEIFESRAASINCANDPGETIFTTQIDLDKPGFLCPQPFTIEPCICNRFRHQLECEGSNVTQEVITNLLTSVRTMNALTAEDLLEILELTIRVTDLQEIDLNFLHRCHIADLRIYYNYALASILTSAVEGQPLQIEATSLSLYNNNLTDEGLTNALKAFVPTVMTRLELGRNKIEGRQWPLGDGSGDIEFLRGLASLTNIENLDLSHNQIQLIGGGQFKRNGRLVELDLSSNQISILDEDAFATNFNGDLVDERKIDLSFNELTDDGVNENHGLFSWPNSTSVDFELNNFESLSRDNWEIFLTSNEMTNSLHFSYNNFYCNETMRWLKEGREFYEFRVVQVDCTNDPGKNIFTTDLV